MTRRRKLSVYLGLPVVLLTAGLYGGWPYLESAGFVVRAAGMDGLLRSAARLTTNRFDERLVSVPWRGGMLRGRLYVPRATPERAVLLAPGIHNAGVDEPRLVQFARDLAATDLATLTVELPDLVQYRIEPGSTDMIEDAARWLSEQRALAPDGQVGLIGISFAGGLSVVAAGRPSIRERVAFALSFGGHGRLPRTLAYLVTGVQPDGARRPPHDYGVAIILLGVADRVVPAEQVQPLRAAIRAFLDASHLDMVDKPAAARAFAHARTLAETLPQPAQQLMGYVNDRDVEALGPILLPHVADMGGDAALSPEDAPPPAAPVYLLHGSSDNVIPAVESSRLASALRSRGVTVNHLITPLVTHAEVDRSSGVPEIWRLVRFWAGVLDK